MKPIKDKLVVKPSGDEKKTDSGIILPDAERKEKFLESGTVVSIGGEVDESIKPGMKIYYDRWAGVPITIDDEKMLVIKNKEVQAVYLW